MDDYQGKAFATGPADGYSADASFMPAAAAYGAGDIMAATQEMIFTGRKGLLVPEKSLVRILSATLKIGVASVPSGQSSYTLHCYSVAPPSAQADNDAWSLDAGDLDGYLGSIPLGAPSDIGGALFVRAQAIDLDFRLITPSIFARLVTDGAHTAAAVARAVSLNAMAI